MSYWEHEQLQVQIMARVTISPNRFLTGFSWLDKPQFLVSSYLHLILCHCLSRLRLINNRHPLTWEVSERL